MLISPRSRMDILTDAEMDRITRSSQLVSKYNEEIDRESAYEMLNEKISSMVAEAPAKKPVKEEPSTFEKIAGNTVVKSMMRTAGNQIVRSILGNLGLGGRTRKKSWF